MLSLVDFVGLCGLAIIITKGTLFARLRQLYPPLLTCPLCIGFWVGLTGAILRVPPEPTLFRALQTFVLHGAAVALGAFLAGRTLDWLDARS